MKDRLAVRKVAIAGGSLQSAAATALVALAAYWLSWSWPAGIVFGVPISVASTVMLMLVLSDQGDPHTHSGRIAAGWLLFEDIFTVLALVILSVDFGAKGGGSARARA